MTEQPPNFRDVDCCNNCTRWEPLLEPNCQKFKKQTYPSNLCDGFEVMS
ncbi:MAG: hypothetical protein MUO73_08485 [Thermoplasmata archaeon]|nr:hypothetical protein [Thermoplasmata archaeon]